MARTTLPKHHDYDFAPLIKKYLHILDSEDLEAPAVSVVKAKLGRCWLGLNSWYWTRPTTTHIEIDERVTDHMHTLERIFAHEMVHHVEHVRLGQKHMDVLTSGNRHAIKRFLSLVKSSGHGRSFHEGAAKVNAVMGKDFVTQSSDQSYECAPSEKSFLMLIVPLDPQGKRLGFRWGIKPSNKALMFIQSKLIVPGEPGARLVRATGDHWTRGTVEFLSKSGGWAVPSDPEAARELRELYERGERMKVDQDDYDYKYSVVPMRASGATSGRSRTCSRIAAYEDKLPAALIKRRSRR